MTEIDIFVPKQCRRWQLVLAGRLSAAGHDVRLVRSQEPDAWPALLDSVLGLERRLSHGGERLSARVEFPAGEAQAARPGSTVIDLAGSVSALVSDKALTVTFDGSRSAAAAAIAIAANRLPAVRIMRGGRTVAEARPMVDSRLVVGRGLEDVLARAISLVVSTVDRIDAGVGGPSVAPDAPPEQPSSAALAGSLAFGTAPRLARETLRRLRHWPSHWRVGYRFHDGKGVAETGSLAGPAWSILPDDGRRYYADPFPFEHDGRHFIFVEEYPHETGKGLISVAEFDRQRRPAAPRVVLEEPFHLSYPQVFSLDGQVWMLPEGGAGRQLVLYRAEAFPDRWVRHAVLVEGRELFDATLLDHGGRYWLLAAERDGAGSTSDMLVAFHAERLEGPWTPHKANPILIDRAAARPGGAFVRVGRRIVHPVQDGTLGYGGGLGLSDVIRLDEEKVELSQPVPVLGARNWPYPKIHTLNRAGHLEVIDGLAEVRRGAAMGETEAA